MNHKDDNRLSTIGELSPGRVLERFGNTAVILIAIGVWARESHVGLLEQKGKWVKEIWDSALSNLPKLEGCRLLWNTLFFATSGEDAQMIRDQFRDILTNLYDPDLKSFCVIGEASGTPEEKLLVLEDMQSEIWGELDFGKHAHIQYRLLDGKPWGSDQ